ncbi:MAG TPA: hypothetical protein PLO69_11010 [Gammaproteobacteria bacterium]|nr:hypothetical protein [Gammaproteobacteria bacterium]
MDRTTASGYTMIAGLRAFQNANPAAGISEGTAISATDTQAWQEEILGLIEGAGLAPSAANLKQAAQALGAVAGAQLTSVLSSVSANVALTPWQAGLIEVDATTAPVTITLPAANGLNQFVAAFTFYRTDVTTNTVTIQAAGTEKIYPGAVSSVTLPPAWPLRLKSDMNNWIGDAGRAGPYAPLGTSSLAPNGWRKVADGNSPTGYFIEQWGTNAIITTASGLTSQSFSLPVTFPTVFMLPGAWWNGTTPPATGNIASSAVSLGQIEISVNVPAAGTYGFAFLAKGY